MAEINVFIDSLKVTWIRKMLKEDRRMCQIFTYRNTVDLHSYFLSAVL